VEFFGLGAVPLDKPIPYDLVERVVKYRVKENLAMRKR
jgi:uncharacterized protein YdhG (YjbR/CyaY superfamily)